MKLKQLLAANTKVGFGAHSDKKVPRAYNVNILLHLFMLWVYFSAASPGHLVQMQSFMDSIK